MTDHSPTALTIAGFDPSTGAGVTADLLTFAAHGIFATAAITALTVQSTLGVFQVEPVSPTLLRATLQRLEDDLPPLGIKLGMLGSAAHAQVVAEYLANTRARRHLHVVLDPILRSSSGATLLDTVDTLRALVPLADAITPNLHEAAALTGITCNTPEDMQLCADHMHAAHPNLHVVLTGGHLPQPVDLLYDGDGLHWFPGTHIDTASTHGTGCAFSTALLAHRLLGLPWIDAVPAAKRHVAHAMQHAVPRGQGRGPLALLPQLERS